MKRSGSCDIQESAGRQSWKGAHDRKTRTAMRLLSENRMGRSVPQTFPLSGSGENVRRQKNAPVIRGVLNFIDSLVLGMRSLTYSASFFEEEDKKRKEEDPAKAEKKRKKREMGITVAFSVIVAVAALMVSPYLPFRWSFAVLWHHRRYLR